MLKIKDSTGKVIGVLRDEDSAPDMKVHTDTCPVKRGKLLNCSCPTEAELEQSERTTE